METRIVKKSRFQIAKLEERIAPSAYAQASATAIAHGPTSASAVISAYTNVYGAGTVYAFNAATAGSSSTASAN